VAFLSAPQAGVCARLHWLKGISREGGSNRDERGEAPPVGGCGQGKHGKKPVQGTNDGGRPPRADKQGEIGGQRPVSGLHFRYQKTKQTPRRKRLLRLRDGFHLECLFSEVEYFVRGTHRGGHPFRLLGYGWISVIPPGKERHPGRVARVLPSFRVSRSWEQEEIGKREEKEVSISNFSKLVRRRGNIGHARSPSESKGPKGGERQGYDKHKRNVEGGLGLKLGQMESRKKILEKG